MKNYMLRCGDLDWIGMADSHEDAFRRALEEEDCSGMSLGRLVECVEIPDEGPSYMATERMLERFGLIMAKEGS